MTNVRTIRVALAGCGTVGSGVAEIVVDRADELAERTGLRFDIVRVLVADLSKTRYVALDQSLFTADPAALLAAEADMVVEVIGGTETARDVVLTALEAGQPVVTANKALLALHGQEIFQTAHEHDTCIAFEASCLGGLPIVTALLRGLPANRIDALAGIFNSTCNFVLTQMLDHNVPLADAVHEAQERGYAEADPTLDINGTDTAHKLTILASLAFGLNLDFHPVVTEGIESLQLTDLRIAGELGYSCKLLGLAHRIYEPGTDGEESGRPAQPSDLVSLRVHPMLVPQANPIAGMSGTSSGISIAGDAVGETFYAGGGAGSLPTASGVVADMIDVASGAAQPTFAQLRVFNDRTPPARYANPDDASTPFSVRFDIDPAPAAADELEHQCRQASIPVQAVHVLKKHRAVVIITDPLGEGRFRDALASVTSSMDLTTEPVVLRILTDQGSS